MNLIPMSCWVDMVDKAEAEGAELADPAMTGLAMMLEDDIETILDRGGLVQGKINDLVAKAKGVKVEAEEHFFLLSDRSDESEEVESECGRDFRVKDPGEGVSSRISENTVLSHVAIRGVLDRLKQLK
ncbi:hypothetical protein NDU88_004744 [Pleurodeles waltl]|uniref:Uncharacterized protein n=1 Tax=Pleurodeles waltl TaxID=8319 RepID=A0AAV7L7K5_PLEWA|nr:hypothetical protein NDU88_004744 [Pleurodeles waltl]